MIRTTLQKSSAPQETLTSSVYERIRNDILSGQLQPGSKLRLHNLKQHYAVGSSPIREALNRLSAFGMVVCEENRGFRVSPASISELKELSMTRCWLEEIALRESIKCGDTDWEERIVLAFHRLSRATQRDGEDHYTSPDWEAHHQEFHMSLLSACNSNILLGYCSDLFEQTLRYRNLTSVVAYRGHHEMEEHRAIYEAVIGRNVEKSIELLIAHYQVTAKIVISSGILK